MKQKDGTITNNRQEILDVCANFYQDLYSSKTKNSEIDMHCPSLNKTIQLKFLKLFLAKNGIDPLMTFDIQKEHT